jgi:hypothetical protein
MPEGEGKTPPQISEKHLQTEESRFRALFAKLRKRRIIETLAAFIGGGWLLVEVVERLLVSHYRFPLRCEGEQRKMPSLGACVIS